MIRRWLWTLTILTLLMPVQAFAAGSCVFSIPTTGSGFTQYQWVCTADGSGDVSSPTITGDGYTQKLFGKLVQFTITPGTGGDAPDALYDVDLFDSNDATINYLGTSGDNLSQTVTAIGAPVTPDGWSWFLYYRQVTPSASGCGASNKFTLSILMYDPYRGH